MPATKELLEYALDIGALELILEGRELKSKRISPYFFNSGLFRRGQSISVLAEAYAETLYRLDFNILFGPAYKGIPLVTAVAMALHYKFNQNVAYAYNRKEEKDHGEGGILIGEPMQGKKVFIIDDVITQGSTARESIDIVRSNGGIVVGYAIAFDRQERGTGEDRLSAAQEIHWAYDIPVVAAATLEDLIAVLREKGIREMFNGKSIPVKLILKKILEYKDRYGCAT